MVSRKAITADITVVHEQTREAAPGLLSGLLHRVHTNTYAGRSYQTNEVFQLASVIDLRGKLDVGSRSVAQTAGGKTDHGELSLASDAEDSSIFVDGADLAA